MTIAVLIQSIVRQTTILIAQLATTGRARAPLAQIADQVFAELVLELERQGVSRKVTADMFGVSLRTFQRRIQHLEESPTEQGRSTWEAVLGFIRSRSPLTRTEILTHFARDDDARVRSVLRDLCESKLVYSTGMGPSTGYRAATEDELGALWRLQGAAGFDELLWALIYRDGPITLAELAQQVHVDEQTLGEALARLSGSGRIEGTEKAGGNGYSARRLLIPLGSPVGWEAAVFDHFKAMVNTIAGKLREERSAPTLSDTVGGSTYTLDVWPGHPLADEVYGTLGRLRATMVELRERVEAVNAQQELPVPYARVVAYVGQCVINENAHEDDEEAH
jgi:DNA-binding Lrp family transcriptional regulator